MATCRPAWCLTSPWGPRDEPSYGDSQVDAQRALLQRDVVMTYATLMVHLELGRANAGLLQVVGDLAERCAAGVIGIAACQPMQMVYADGYVATEVYEQDNRQLQQEICAAEAEFRVALQTRAKRLEWRSSIWATPPSDYVAREARAADLVITGVASGGLLDAPHTVRTGDLIMQVGRPVFVVPATATQLKLHRAIIGWKDTRESRRALLDALPLLKLAGQVTVVEIAAPDAMDAARSHGQDVVHWLSHHGVQSEALAQPTTGDDAVGLYTVAQDLGADVIVAGAYGHSRLIEWALGGVTRDLLLRQDFCALLSH